MKTLRRLMRALTDSPELRGLRQTLEDMERLTAQITERATTRTYPQDTSKGNFQ